MTLDANILVRANFRSKGPARELPGVIRASTQHTLVLSRHILNEVEETLKYPRLRKQFDLSDENISEHVALLRRAAALVEPVVSFPVVLKDPDDDLVVYTPVEGRADVPVRAIRIFMLPMSSPFAGNEASRSRMKSRFWRN